MEPNALINEFIVIYGNILQNYTPYRLLIINIFSIIIFQGLVARQPYLCKLHIYMVLGTFVNGSCDIKINIKIVKIAV